MVLPVTGPTLKPIANSLSAYRDKRNWTQAKPIDRPLLYYTDSAWCRNPPANANLGFGAQWFGPSDSYHIPNAQASYASEIAQAYAKLVGEITSNAQIGATLAEGRQSLQMMFGRLGQLADFTRRVRRLDFLGAARVVNLAIVPKGVSAKRSLANNWLEYSFGWRPLIQDIYNAVDHLQEPVKNFYPKGKSKNDYQKFSLTGSIASGFFSQQTTLGVKFAKMGCEIRVDNPNLLLANKLGLANPAAIVWELIPFSFVVDWFATVGDFLSAGTDFLGLTVTNPWTLFGVQAMCQDYRGNPFWVPKTALAMWQCVHMERLVSLVGPTLRVRPPRLWGWGRVANAASVLIQLMSKR